MIDEATQRFIRAHLDDDVLQLALNGGKAAKAEGADLAVALCQIGGRQTARRKLPSWAEVDGIVYPPHLSLEQCSSEAAALYKAAIASRCAAACEGGAASMVDLTGGFGVDFAFMAPSFALATYVERQEHLCRAASHNFRLLGVEARVVCGEASEVLAGTVSTDLIFLDPARRDAHGARTYDIADCSPDVSAMMPELLAKGRHVLIKLSPMLDWRKAAETLGWSSVAEVHIVSLGGECRELLFLLSARHPAPRLFCTSDDDTLSLAIATDGSLLPPCAAAPAPSCHLPAAPAEGLFLYEPNPSVMKAGCFAALEQMYRARQIAPNSHLFVSDTLLADFPGRKFRISGVASMNKRQLKALLSQTTRANVAVRNFPLSVAQLRQRLRLADGGDSYVFATTLADGTHAIVLTHKT